MSIKTYRGIVRGGKIEAAREDHRSFELAEGSEVYVVVPTQITAEVARRKATAWLVGHVGNLLMADHGTLVHSESGWVWRFNVLITSPAHDPWGPIGVVDIDAETGVILNPEQTREQLHELGRTYQPPI